jgi:hypothetical protein
MNEKELQRGIKGNNGKGILIPFSHLTPEERSEITRKGGIASGKKKREKKLIAQELEKRLAQRKVVKFNEETGEKEVINGFEAMVEIMINQMLEEENRETIQAKTKVFEVIRDTMGQKPKENIDMTVNKYEEALTSLTGKKKTIDDEEDGEF